MPLTSQSMRNVHAPCPCSQHCPGLVLRPEERAAELIHWALPPHPGALQRQAQEVNVLPFLGKTSLDISCGSAHRGGQQGTVTQRHQDLPALSAIDAIVTTWHWDEPAGRAMPSITVQFCKQHCRRQREPSTCFLHVDLLGPALEKEDLTFFLHQHGCLRA